MNLVCLLRGHELSEAVKRWSEGHPTPDFIQICNRCGGEFHDQKQEREYMDLWVEVAFEMKREGGDVILRARSKEEQLVRMRELWREQT